MTCEPQNELTLRGLTSGNRVDRLAICFGGFVSKPFVPVTADSLNRAAQKRAGARSLCAPVPESPEPNEVKRAARRDDSLVKRC